MRLKWNKGGLEMEEAITDREEILKRTFNKVDRRPGCSFLLQQKTVEYVPEKSLTVIYPVKEEFLC